MRAHCCAVRPNREWGGRLGVGPHVAVTVTTVTVTVTVIRYYHPCTAVDRATPFDLAAFSVDRLCSTRSQRANMVITIVGRD